MNKRTKTLLIMLCAVLLLGIFFFAAYHSYQSWQYTNQVFGHTFGTALNLYANYYGYYLIDIPEYCVTDSGLLYTVERSGEKYLTTQLGTLETFQLNETNFDDCFSGASWTAMDTDAVSIRTHTVKAWRYTDGNGRLVYLLLQDNSDVLLVRGTWQNDITLSSVYLLHDLGSDDIFFDTYE